MLHPTALSKYSALYGVSDDQIRRDHLISHVLNTLPAVVDDGAYFYGGTALCRTYRTDTRLSEKGFR